ncbi:putative Ig domain-containing protein [Polaromonas sp. SM01]|uniref:putative Ig domain-containing protein n=1 Tax=Polaromonas sp. SM01 TaxID=3085630 RepID=UPI0029827B94|nr:putative Ig domain-containing protein [Polaromonas sp. SM01]MDW5442299.1 putative Ig domain-containing protein [Polaromonas sp. SM01]
MLQELSVRAGSGVSSGQRGVGPLWAVLALLGQLGRLASWRGSATGLGRWLAFSFCAAVMLLGGAGLAHAASNCPSPRSITVNPGGTYYEDYSNSLCSQFGLTGTLVQPAHGSLEDSNVTNAVRYINNGDGAPSDTFTVKDDVAQPIVYNVTIGLSLSPSSVPAATVGQAYSPTTLSTTGGTAPYTYTLIAGSLPPGMTLPSAGTLAGTPAAAGTFNFTVKATDALAISGTRAYSLTVAAPTITIAPPVLPAMTEGTAYNQAITASGGTATYSYAITSGSLPTGLSLASTGILSGTPTLAGPYNFTVSATDSSTGTSAPFTGSRAYSVTVASGTPVAGAVSVNVLYGSNANAITLNLSGGAATSVAVATAAAHGTATASGTSITYTPTPGYGGPDSFTYTATNGFGTSTPATVTITVGTPFITVAPSTLPVASIGAAYSQSLSAANGTGPYTYVVSNGALPAGLSLSGGGVLSGIPTAAGTFYFTLRATDSSSGGGPYSGARAYSMTVAAPTISVAPSTMPSMTAGVAYSQAITATGGTATYSYAITGGSLPTGLSLASNGTLSGTPTAAGPFNFTVTATDSSTGSGPYTGSRAYSVTVAAGAPVAGNVSATVAFGSSANPITLNLSGGAATSVAVGSGAAHGTATASGTSITYTPTAGYGGPDSFTYTATNGIGTSAPATVTITVGTPSITMTPSSVPVAAVGTAYSQNISAANGLGPYTYVVSVGALPAGLSLSGGGLLSGTPTAAGSFNFTVRATDSSSGGGPYSGVQAYTLTVAAPTITVTPTTLPAMTGGTAYNQTITATGGTAPYSYAITSGSLPTGLSLGVSSGTLSGTPTLAGAYNFSVTATDSSTGTGFPFMKTVFYTVTVASGTPVAGAVSATVAYGSAANPITLNLSGGVATSVAVATAAAHGTATASGTSITYRPTAGYSGADSFTYTATNAAGTSAPATVSVTVGAAPVVVVDDNTSTPTNQAVSIPVTANDSGPITSIAISTPPAHGSAVVNGLSVVYTPANNYAGTDTLRYTATGPGGTSAPATVTISINPVPLAGAHSATVRAGVAVTIDLMAGATGGPFNAASIVAVTPAAAGTALISDVGAAGSPSFQMSFTAAGAFAGSAVVSYTLRNAHATSAPGQVTITVAPRPDMATNAEVTGLLTAQTDSAKRFATAQLSNFSRRLESLHGTGWARSDFGLSLASSTGRTAAEEAPRNNGEADRYVGASSQANLRKVGWSQRRGTDASAQDYGGGIAVAAADPAAAGSGLPHLPESRDQAQQAFSWWVGGALDYGRQDAKGQQADYKFSTSGLSLGVDYRLGDRATIGMGAGVSRGSTTIGNDGSKSSAGSTVAVVYGSLRPAKDVFIDGILGYGKLDFDTTRYITDGGGFATGTRQGDQIFGSLASGVEYRGASWLWSPYGRIERSSTKLDAYTETAPNLKALTYFKQTVRTTNGILGLRAEGRYAIALGLLMPRVRVEFNHRFEGTDEARLAYADLGPGGPVYVVRSNAQDFGNWTTGLGAKLVLRNGVALSLDFNTNINMSSGRSQSLTFGVNAPF